MRLVRRQIDALRGFRNRHLLLVQGLRLPPEIAQKRLEVPDRLLAGERIAMAGDHMREVHALQLLEVVGPFVVEAEIEGAGAIALPEIAGYDHLLPRQIDEHIGVAVAAAWMDDLNLAIAAEDGEAIG